MFVFVYVCHILFSEKWLFPKKNVGSVPKENIYIYVKFDWLLLRLRKQVDKSADSGLWVVQLIARD